MRPPGVEPGSQAWEACMMPLHYMRCALLAAARLKRSPALHSNFKTTKTTGGAGDMRNCKGCPCRRVRKLSSTLESRSHYANLDKCTWVRREREREDKERERERLVDLPSSQAPRFWADPDSGLVWPPGQAVASRPCRETTGLTAQLVRAYGR